MTDLDDGLDAQLRHCLTRHADDAAVDRELATAVQQRSRQLGRRGPAMAVAAVVPITAAIVVGAVLLGGSSPAAAPQRVTVRPAASVTATKSASPKPTALPHASLQVCPTGKIPNVHLSRGRLLLTEKTLNTAHGKPVRAYALVQRYAINGKPVAHDSTVFLVAMAVGPHGRAWQVLEQDGSGKKSIAHATFLGCIRVH